MGCCISSPINNRIYRDPGDLDEEYLPIRTFGKIRNNSNVLPDDLGALSNVHVHSHLGTNPPIELLYDGETDQGYAFRCLRPLVACFFFPPVILALFYTHGFKKVVGYCPCDEIFCWVRKEYASRHYTRVYANRIEINQPQVRWWGACFGCGSWNSDQITSHVFDRGAFGFRKVSIGAYNVCCCLPLFGGSVARQRCQCNGSLWPRMFSDCGGCWCDEWPCDILCCSYRYPGLADPEEFAFAASIALQAYFEGRAINKEMMDECIEYWKREISEKGDPVGRKRGVCCEPICIPMPWCGRFFYEFTHFPRVIPWSYKHPTEQIKEAYEKYDELIEKQIRDFEEYEYPYHKTTLCQSLGCRRLFGRKGFFFCTEDMTNCCSHKAGDPAPPFSRRDWDDDNDAAKILQRLFGDPPRNIKYQRYGDDDEEQGHQQQHDNNTHKNNNNNNQTTSSSANPSLPSRQQAATTTTAAQNDLTTAKDNDNNILPSAATTTAAAVVGNDNNNPLLLDSNNIIISVEGGGEEVVSSSIVVNDTTTTNASSTSLRKRSQQQSQQQPQIIMPI